MKIHFITGASGSGKTAIIPYLRESLGGDVAVYDFDEIGVPENADAKWRGKATEEWLQRLLSEGKNTCLLGQMVPGEILACPSAPHLTEPPLFCHLDVEDFARIQRLKNASSPCATQDTLNWAAWLRMHIQDLHWRLDVIQNNAWDELDFSKLKLDKGAAPLKVKILDTTYLDARAVATKVADWILGVPEKLPLGLYQHFKGNYYRVVDVARYSENLEDLVVYQALYEDFGLWIRPLKMFLETVELEGETKPRFRLLSPCPHTVHDSI